MGIFKTKGIDVCKERIDQAKIRQRLLNNRNLLSKLSYSHQSIEEESSKYDIVIASEVLEHVPNYDTFIAHLCQKTNKNGYCMITTLNKTVLSYFAAILIGEYILNLVPKHTHEYEKFVTPQNLEHSMLK
ncbi:MAG: Hexaprenyldihydroxybenzoate methyltransferase, mitochondrial, partial [Paramarteilia canceri]